VASKASPKPVAPPSRAVLKRDNKAKNYILIVVIVTFLVVIGSGLFAKALLGSIILDSKLIIYTNKANGDLTQKLQDIPQLISNYNSLGTNQSLIAAALPTNPDFPALVSVSAAMATDSGATLKSVAPDASELETTTTSSTPSSTGTSATATGSTTSTAATGASTPQTYDFDVVIVGTYSQVVQYFQDIEKSARPMKVASTTLTGDGGSLQVSAVIETYYQAAANTSDTTGTVK
jgi:hypothetical protein